MIRIRLAAWGNTEAEMDNDLQWTLPVVPEGVDTERLLSVLRWLPLSVKVGGWWGVYPQIWNEAGMQALERLGGGEILLDDTETVPDVNDTWLDEEEPPPPPPPPLPPGYILI